MRAEKKLETLNSFQEMLSLLDANTDGTIDKSRAYVGFLGWKSVKIKGYSGDVSTSHLLVFMMQLARRQKYEFTSEERLALRKVELILEKVDDDLDEKKEKANFITQFFIWLLNPDNRHEKCNVRAFDWEEVRQGGLYISDYYLLDDYKNKYQEEPEDLEMHSHGFNGGYRVYANDKERQILISV